MQAMDQKNISPQRCVSQITDGIPGDARDRQNAVMFDLAVFDHGDEHFGSLDADLVGGNMRWKKFTLIELLVVIAC